MRTPLVSIRRETGGTGMLAATAIPPPAEWRCSVAARYSKRSTSVRTARRGAFDVAEPGRCPVR